MEAQSLESMVVVVGVIFAAIVLILWIILPFAVFGVKKRLDQANELNERILTVLKVVASRLPKSTGDAQTESEQGSTKNKEKRTEPVI